MTASTLTETRQQVTLGYKRCADKGWASGRDPGPSLLSELLSDLMKTSHTIDGQVFIDVPVLPKSLLHVSLPSPPPQRRRDSRWTRERMSFCIVRAGRERMAATQAWAQGRGLGFGSRWGQGAQNHGGGGMDSRRGKEVVPFNVVGEKYRQIGVPPPFRRSAVLRAAITAPR